MSVDFPRIWKILFSQFFFQRCEVLSCVFCPGAVKSDGNDGNLILTSESAWNLLGLTYNVDWPLHILFTSGVLEKLVLLAQK